ncbi:MAG: HD-GYP domain-containing protein [Lautropia sp.]
MTAWMAEAGHTCAPVDTAEALAEARRVAPDVAVVLAAAPDDGDMWVARMLRAQPEPVVIVVALAWAEAVAVMATQLGALDCVPWPSGKATMCDAVERALAWRDRGHERARRLGQLKEELARSQAHLAATARRVEPARVTSVLLAVLEARAPDACEHSRRVARSAAVLADTLRLPPAQAREIRDAALLHDIGKVALPPRLLSPAEPLSDDELALLRTHVQVTRHVLSPVAGMRPLATIASSVHERWDGLGYPDGLSGAAIPLGARLVAVCHAYDTATTAGAAGDAAGHDEAALDLIRLSGTRLDPDMVRAWLVMGDAFRCCS